MMKIDESKIFLIQCSCVVRFSPNARREKFSQTWRRIQKVGNDRQTLGKLPRGKVKAQILRNLRFSVASSPKCHLIFDMTTSCPAVPYCEPAVNRQPGYRREDSQSPLQNIWNTFSFHRNTKAWIQSINQNRVALHAHMANYKIYLAPLDTRFSLPSTFYFELLGTTQSILYLDILAVLRRSPPDAFATRSSTVCSRRFQKYINLR